MKIQVIEVEVSLRARDHLSLRLEVNDSKQILSSRLKGQGCLAFLKEMVGLRDYLRAHPNSLLQDIPIPSGTSHSAMLIRESILKVQGLWKLPYQEEEICHCRAVPTQKVDEAIVSGCHTVERIKRVTSASTSCGTCRPDIESLIRYRLQGS